MKRLSVRARLPRRGLSYLRGVSTVARSLARKGTLCEREEDSGG